jgi:hypothetical protein
LRSSTYLLALLGLGFAGATTVAWRQYQELIALRAAALANDDRAAIEARLAELKKKNHDLQALLAALQQAKTNSDYAAANAKSAEKDRADILLAKLAAASAAVNGDEAKRDEQFALLAAMADQPEFQKLLALQQRGRIDGKYATLFRQLKLNPDELDRLQTLLSEKQSAYADAMIAARDQGLAGKDARDLAATVSRATQKDLETSIKDLLGPQRYGQYQTYERTEPQRQLVDQLAQRLSYSATPLSLSQQDQLVQTLASTATTVVTRPANAQGKGGGDVVRPMQPIAPLTGALSGLGIASTASAPVTPAAIAQSQSFLQPQQVVALQRVQQEQTAQQTLNGLLNANKPSASVPTVKPPGK